MEAMSDDKSMSSNKEEGSNDVFLDDDTIALVATNDVTSTENKRYLDGGRCRTTTQADITFWEDLRHEEDDEVAWLNDNEFLGKHRMSWEHFNEILLLIQRDPVFESANNKGRPQHPISHQLLGTLKAFGT